MCTFNRMNIELIGNYAKFCYDLASRTGGAAAAATGCVVWSEEGEDGVKMYLACRCPFSLLSA